MKTDKIAALFDLLDGLFPRVKGVDAFSWNPRRETVGTLFASIDGGRAELRDIRAEDARMREALEEAVANIEKYTSGDLATDVGKWLKKARAVLSSEPSGKLEGLLQLTEGTQQLLTALNLVAIEREKLRGMCELADANTFPRKHLDLLQKDDGDNGDQIKGWREECGIARGRLLILHEKLDNLLKED